MGSLYYTIGKPCLELGKCHFRGVENSEGWSLLWVQLYMVGKYTSGILIKASHPFELHVLYKVGLPLSKHGVKPYMV